MNEMSLEQQISCLKEMRSYLGDFCVEMRQTMEMLQDQIRALKAQGFSVETEQTYQKRYFEPANNDVEQVVNDIQVNHFNYINQVIEHLERARDRE